MTNPIPQKLQDEILAILNHWSSIIAADKEFPTNIVALNFGLQKVWDSYELYLEGFTWYEDKDDTWLQFEAWSPAYNFISLSSEFLYMETSDLLKIYKDILTEQIRAGNLAFPKQIQAVTVCFVIGLPDRII